MGNAYDDLNRDKEVIALNLTQSEDHARFAELVRKADGLIEGFRPKAKQKLGLDEKTLHRINPKICIASLVGFPEQGPWRDRAGHDLNFQALSGCLSLSKEMPPLPWADLFSAYEGAFRLATAMDAVARGAQGTRVVISMLEVIQAVQSTLVADFIQTKKIPRPGQTLFSGKYPCYRIYTAKDGKRVSVGAIERKFWEKVCEILKLPKLKDHGYAEGAQGKEAIQKIQTAFEKKPWSHWAPLFDAADCCVEPVLDYSEVYPNGRV
jgi:crotonobetainyl-CoA:carnitine CoA-transferase CaiB-like acyl-CoA transferase